MSLDHKCMNVNLIYNQIKYVRVYLFNLDKINQWLKSQSAAFAIKL
jgi:hypothetical protein